MGAQHNHKKGRPVESVRQNVLANRHVAGIKITCRASHNGTQKCFGESNATQARPPATEENNPAQRAKRKKLMFVTPRLDG